MTPDSVVISATMVPGRCGVAMRTLPYPVTAANPSVETKTSAVPLPGIEIVVEPAATPVLLNAVWLRRAELDAMLTRELQKVWGCDGGDAPLVSTLTCERCPLHAKTTERPIEPLRKA